MSYQTLADAETPRRYKRNYLFRSLGFELPILLRPGNSEDEVFKSVYRTSLKSALSESAVHIIPSLASLTVVIFNLKILYLSPTLLGKISVAVINIALLQVAVKLVELLVIASLTSIVLHTIKDEMVLDDGLPFEAISGAFMFSSVKYLWSSEF